MGLDFSFDLNALVINTRLSDPSEQQLDSTRQLMQIQFVYPTKVDAWHNPIKYKRAFLPPLALATLSGATPKQHTVTVVNDIVEKIDYTNDVDLVGISAMTCQATRAYQIADAYRTRGVPVVIGGVHASFLPDEALEHADSVVAGEAEHIWDQIVTDFERNVAKERYQAEPSCDLTSGPLPDWNGFNLGIYAQPPWRNLPIMPVFTTRGCPFGCHFCSVTQFFGKHYRTKPIARVLSEIDNTGSNQIFFVDDNLVCQPDYSRELFRALRGKNLRWYSQVSTHILREPDLLELAAKSGCTGLLVGLESIDQNSLDSVGKQSNRQEEYLELFERMKRVGIVPTATLIFGFDTENQRSFDTTFHFLNKYLQGYAVFFILTPLPGTRVFEQLESENRLLHRDWSQYDMNQVVFRPQNMSTTALQRGYWKTFQRFYSLRNTLPRLASILRAAWTPKTETLLEHGFYQLYFRHLAKESEHPFSGGFGRQPCNRVVSTLPSRSSAHANWNPSRHYK